MALILVLTSGCVITGLDVCKISILMLGTGLPGALPIARLYPSSVISPLSSFSRKTTASGHLKWAISAGGWYFPGFFWKSTIGFGIVASCCPNSHDVSAEAVPPGDIVFPVSACRYIAALMPFSPKNWRPSDQAVFRLTGLLRAYSRANSVIVSAGTPQISSAHCGVLSVPSITPST